MTYELKPIHKEAIPAALERAHRYRLLNEPTQAGSICRDILEVDADNKEALILLLLALTDEFPSRMSTAVQEARDVLGRLSDEYDRIYFEGVIYERRAKAHFDKQGPGSGHVAYEWFLKAMESYDRADKMSSSENDEARLRWNTCARILMNNPSLTRAPEDQTPQLLE